MKNNSFVIALTVVSAFSLSSCSKWGTLSENDFTSAPTPLEVVGGKVETTIDGRFPAKFMPKKGQLYVTPELRYANGAIAKGEQVAFQGEKVPGNAQSVSYKTGGRFTTKSSFNYIPEMQKSDLYLTFDAVKGKKRATIPALRVGYGVIATSQLYKRTLLDDGFCIAPDSFQRVKTAKQEANIRFLVNQANLRKSELKNNSVEEFVKLLKKINQDREGLNLQNVQIRAYASPEGGYTFNDKLAYKRQNTGEGYVKDQLKQNKIDTNIDAEYTAQDWEGFQQLVSASNIQDKDVILRVLSMYKDPQERERQIRNMSQAFRELTTGILPELRRARLIINYETIGRSDEQIASQYTSDASRLSVDELLYLASLKNSDTEAINIYRETARLYDRDYRAFNNLGVLYAQQGNNVEARRYFREALSKNRNAEEATVNLGLLALQEGDIQTAESMISQASNANDMYKALGVLNIAKGNYASAEQNLKDYNNNSAILARILNKNYAGAEAKIAEKKSANGMTNYLNAIVKARQGNTSAAREALNRAVSKDSSLAQYAQNDLEFANVR